MRSSIFSQRDREDASADASPVLHKWYLNNGARDAKTGLAVSASSDVSHSRSSISPTLGLRRVTSS